MGLEANIPLAMKPLSVSKLISDKEKRDKRSKACTNCRKSKVKCIKDDNDESCKRCKTQGLQCAYEFKIASYKYANGPPEQSMILSSVESNDLNAVTKYLQPNNGNGVVSTNIAGEWKSSVDNRLNDFDSKLGAILNLLERQQSPSPAPLPSPTPESNKRCIEDSVHEVKRPKLDKTPSDLGMVGLRIENILTIDEARILFQYFDKYISPQLFGFDLSHYSVEGIWETCPFLIASICCIASIHHPDFNKLSQPLEALIHQISKDILYHSPKTEVEAFNTIVGLCFCGFWFKKSQMFTGLALQLARTMNLISPNRKNSVISKQDRLKLWYLLYILDGQQSLAFNRHPLLNNNDETFAKPKELLLSSEEEDSDKIVELEKERKEDKEETEDVKYSSNYSNLRLVSQVEYHHALSTVLEGDAWDLLMPSSFGLPFKTNLELDKWMVQWTVLLNPFNNYPVWSSKSTLIYYNFAKMHINSCAVRKFQMNFGGVELPKFDEIVDFNLEENDQSDKESVFNEEDSEDEEDSELDLNTELSTYQSGKVSSELALSAAETVLNIVLNDLDVMKVLRYVPIHIHIMLYYAALLVLKPPKYLLNEGRSSSFETSLKSIQLVKRLVYSIQSNSPTDKEFSTKIVEGLRGLIRDKVATIQGEIKDDETKAKALALALTTENTNTKRKTTKISAWPGYDAGHPSKG